MKKQKAKQPTTSIPQDHCVATSCNSGGVPAEERDKMLLLLGKKAPPHEIHANMKGRPAKFR